MQGRLKDRKWPFYPYKRGESTYPIKSHGVSLDGNRCLTFTVTLWNQLHYNSASISRESRLYIKKMILAHHIHSSLHNFSLRNHGVEA